MVKANVKSAPALRGKVWIQHAGGMAMTEDGADLLEQIAVLGSLSKAAVRLGFSYRRAWMLLDGMNRRWHEPLVTTKIGGRHGGGARLTDLGLNVLSAYRDLQLQLEHMLDQASEGFLRTVGQPAKS